MEKIPSGVERDSRKEPQRHRSFLKKIITVGVFGGTLIAGEHKDASAQNLLVDKPKMEVQDSRDSLIKEGHAHPYNIVFEKDSLLVVRIKSESRDYQRAIDAVTSQALWAFLDYQNIKNVDNNQTGLPKTLDYKTTEQNGVYTVDAVATMPKLKKE